jgi:GDP-mannose 6-dehydrogenase
MKISIFGMGYVGAVSGACFARLGHDVIGVDVNRGKIDMINAGGTPVVEEGLSELMAEARSAGRISASRPTMPSSKHSMVGSGANT